MPDLVIRIKKKTDGSAALSCTRPDGSVTWQRQDGQLGRFFPLHDLTHYAVESVIGFRRAFFGLVADGWDLSDFANAGKRIPDEARLAEMIVGYFDLERITGAVGTADEYNARIREQLAEQKHPDAGLALTDTDLAAIRAVRADAFARWNALPAGDAMELPFDRTGAERPQSHAGTGSGAQSA
jgi:hypothetical protein